MKLQVLRATVQWTAVFTDGDEPPEEVSTEPFTVSARDWPGIVERVDSDLARILEQIVQAGGFRQFQEQVRQQATD